MAILVLDTKIKEVKNKIPGLSDLVKKKDCDAKVSEIEEKCFTTSSYNRFTSDLRDAMIKQNKFVKNLIFLIS